MQLPIRLKPILCAAFFALWLHATAQASASLEGVWKEVDDEATTSVLRFEKSGAVWTGKYVQVSADQASVGFRVGEAVIRGRLEGTRFTGEVLLKGVDVDPACPELGVGWVPARMTLVHSGRRLHGAFLGTLVEDGNACRKTGTYWRQYRLQRTE
ncbi:MAG: hypothetical protein EON50_18130 [Acidovorax sp.]|nr:MAG: hypothetical protein EON50_18130 [Acidovorax sp.]